MEAAAHASTTDLARLEARFRRWRQTRNRGERIPEALWAVAATLARSEGVSPVARALVLDYYRLKERADAQDSPGNTVESPSFVELAVDPAPSPGVKARPNGTTPGSPKRDHLFGFHRS